MSRSTRCRWLLAAAVVAGCLLGAARPAGATEEARRFVEGLRDPDGQLKYFDTALEYLEMARTNPLVGRDFKNVIDYEAGVTLKIWSDTSMERSVQEQRLERAEERFKRFLTEHPGHALTSSANMELAGVLLGRGRLKLAQAALPSTTTAAQARLPIEARRLFGEAEEVLSTLDAELLEEYRSLPKVIDPKQINQLERRDALRGSLLQVRLALAEVVEDVARTYPPGSQGNTDNLEAAAEKFHELYTKYERYLAGLYAYLGEGRCYKELGDVEKALKVCAELLSQPGDSQESRPLRNKTLVLLLQTVLLPEAGEYEKALDEVQKWEKTARGSAESTPEGLAIKYLSGLAALERARALRGGQAAESRRKLLAYAAERFDFVAGFPGEYQKQAREAARLPELVGEDFEPPEPADFWEARDHARLALDLSRYPELPEYERAAARREAIDYFRMAIRLRTPEVTVDEINIIRYYLTYLYLVSDDLYEAAVLGEFLARRYPNSLGSQEAARFALAAYERLLEAAPPEQCQFESDQMDKMARYVVRQWEGEPVATEAWMTLIRTALDDDDLDRAEEYLQQVPVESPRRGQLELMTGQKLWARYLEASRPAEGQRPSRELLEKMVRQAEQILADGISRMRQSVDRPDAVSETLAAAALSLAQINIGEGEPEKALGWLEDPVIGALGLVAAGHPVSHEGNFPVETYKAALRAYVATQQVDKARDAMQHLEELTKEGGDAEAGRRLTQVYISLGRELQNQLERLRNQQKTDQLEKVSAAFGEFLDRICQGEGNDFNSLNWVAEMYVGLGAGLGPGGTAPTPEAIHYYQNAAETYERILQQCGDPEFGAPEGAETSIKIRLARCLRHLGPTEPAQYDRAMALLVEILRVRNTMIDAQIEAANVYQSRGEQDPRYYPLAIRGGQRIKREDGSIVNLVWGWGKIANLVARNPQYESILHQARYNLAWCRFRMALSKQGGERTDLLEEAEKDIRDVHRLYPGMGRGMYLEPDGKDWYDKYDSLLKTIQGLLGTGAEGLKGLEARREAGA